MATRTEMTLKNPFELGSAIKVSLCSRVVLLVTKAATVYLGDQGLYLASALAGTTDVDAVTLSTAKLARDGLAPMIATLSILIAIAVNTIVKTGLARRHRWQGPRQAGGNRCRAHHRGRSRGPRRDRLLG